MKRPNKGGDATGLSRKDLRRQQRQEKKLRKKENFIKKHQSGPVSSASKRPLSSISHGSENDDEPDEDDELIMSEDGEELAKVLGTVPSQKKTADRAEEDKEAKRTKKAKIKPSKKGEEDFLNPDELEVARLEKKLGLHNKSDKDSWKKLEKGLLADGFDKEILDFLREGEKLLAQEAKRTRQAKGSQQAPADASDEEGGDDDDDDGGHEGDGLDDDEFDGGDALDDDESDDDKDEGDDGNEIDEDEDDDQHSEGDKYSDNDEEEDPLASAPTMFLPSDNIYGDQSRPTDRPSKMKTEAMTDRALDIKVRSLMNRSSEENASHIVKELVNLFEAYPIRMVLDAVSRTIFEGVSTATSLLFASLAFALEVRRPNLISHMLETIVLRVVQEGRIEPSPLRLVANFCALGACAASLLFELVDAIAIKHKETPLESNEETLVGILEACGWKMRAADPARFRQTILDLAVQFDSQRLEMHAKSKIDYSAEEDRVKKWRKWLARECKEGSSVPPPLTIPLADFLNAEKNGRWWVLGASWNASGSSSSSTSRHHLNGGQDGEGRLASARSAGTSNPITMAVKNAPKEVIRVAVAQGMKTEVQKAVFCTIMTVEDYIQAFDQLIKLNLNDAGERETVRVIMRCCIHSKRYNPYFALLGSRLCSFQPRYRFSFQLAIWDEIEALDSGALTQSQVTHFARFVADLIAQFSLSLAIFKKWAFAKVASKGRLWFMRECLQALLVLSDDDPDAPSQSRREGDLKAAQIFSRLRSSKDGSLVRDGILVFWSRTEPFMSVSKSKNPLLYKRLNIARRVMEHYVKGEEGEEDGNLGGDSGMIEEAE